MSYLQNFMEDLSTIEKKIATAEVNNVLSPKLQQKILTNIGRKKDMMDNINFYTTKISDTKTILKQTQEIDIFKLLEELLLLENSKEKLLNKKLKSSRKALTSNIKMRTRKKSLKARSA